MGCPANGKESFVNLFNLHVQSDHTNHRDQDFATSEDKVVLI